MKNHIARASALLAAFALPFLASAHEVYVLTQSEIQSDVDGPRFTWWSVVSADMHHFMFWAFLSILAVLLVFGISILRPVERSLMPVMDRLKRYAPAIARVTVGVSFLAPATSYFLPFLVHPPAAAYGPELPLATIWGAYTPEVSAVLAVMGLLITFGIFARVTAFVALCFFALNVYFHGSYMLTYTNYLGEIIVLLLMGAHGGAKHAHVRMGAWQERMARFAHKARPYAFLILRVCFGISLFYASFYAKFLHDDLALDVASGTGILPTVVTHAYTVAQALGFEPHFLVVGAGIIEFVIAFFFMLGIEIRFTSLFLEVWLALSLWYFGEVVWPHVILIGIPIAFIFYGYDKYSVEGWLFKKRKMEPVL